MIFMDGRALVRHQPLLVLLLSKPFLVDMSLATLESYSAAAGVFCSRSGTVTWLYAARFLFTAMHVVAPRVVDTSISAARSVKDLPANVPAVQGLQCYSCSLPTT
jgi:hypothetical protein